MGFDWRNLAKSVLYIPRGLLAYQGEVLDLVGTLIAFVGDIPKFGLAERNTDL